MTQKLSVPVCNSAAPINPDPVLIVAEVFNHRAGSVPPFGNLAGPVLVLDQDPLAQTEWRKVPGVLAPSLQSSGEPCLHGQLSLLSTVHPDLGWREVAWFDWKKILDRTTKDQLGRRELVLRVRSVPVLHYSPGYLVLVWRAVRPRVVHQKSLGRLDGRLGTEVRVRVVGCTDPVFSHSPGLEESSQCFRAKLRPIITGETFWNAEYREIFLQSLDQVSG